MRPSEKNEESVTWTLTYISVGDVFDIVLRLDVTDYFEDDAKIPSDELLNRVAARGGHDGEWVDASNFSTVEVNWLRCCQSEARSVVKVEKTAEKIGNSTNEVRYILSIQNMVNKTWSLRIEDELPFGMKLVDSSVSFDSYEGDLITWNLIYLGPFESRSIVYDVEALTSGRFVNGVWVTVVSADGSLSTPIYAGSAIDVGTFEGERDVSGWQIPDWDLTIDPAYSSDRACDAICDL